MNELTKKRKQKLKYISHGLCKDCGCRPIFKANRCKKHYEKTLEYLDKHKINNEYESKKIEYNFQIKRKCKFIGEV